MENAPFMLEALRHLAPAHRTASPGGSTYDGRGGSSQLKFDCLDDNQVMVQMNDNLPVNTPTEEAAGS